MEIVGIVLSLSVILSLVLFLVKRKYSYWKNMGVPYETPQFPKGNMRGLGTKFHQSMLLNRLYHSLKSAGTPFVGIYVYISPVVLVTSLDFVKTVLIKDFSYFTDRGSYYNEKDGEMIKNTKNLQPFVTITKPITSWHDNNYKAVSIELSCASNYCN